MDMTTTDSMAARTRRSWVWLAAVLASAAFALAAAGPAGASFGVTSFDGTIINQDGSADTQAGSHPFALTTTIQFNQTTDANGNTQPDDNAKDVRVALPPGLVGDPSATPQCGREELLDQERRPSAPACAL
jgi:multidrug efflux pump subunit AcrA (membrane-fusion protein)